MIEHQRTIIAETKNGYRVLETSHPPTYYFPPEDVRAEWLVPVTARTFCEWKGITAYYDLQWEHGNIASVAWSYPSPNAQYRVSEDYIPFYPSNFDTCQIGDETVTAQPGDFYGGWITDGIIGPFKGGLGI